MALEKNRGRKPEKGNLAVIVGAGRSGRAAAELLSREGVKVRLLDKNPDTITEMEREEFRKKDIEVITGEHKSEYFKEADFIIPSPGMAISSLAQYLENNSAEVISEMELAWRYLDSEPVLAVTGTSGKTTTASLAAAMLKAQNYTVFLGGNIGTPLSEYILSNRKADVLVLEVSSFQLQGCTTFCPRVGILLNISPNHLDYHKDMEEYIDAKFRLFRCQDEGDLAIFGPDMEKFFNNYQIASRKLIIEDSGRFPSMKLLGKHNALNAEAAWQAARFFGVSPERAELAVESFLPLPHRLEIVANVNGITYVNDSKCTTAAALKVALEAFNSPVRLLCGGKFKGGDLEALKPLIKEKVEEIALFGGSREVFLKAFSDDVPISYSPTLKEAVTRLAKSAQPGDVVLLAPATSSFDQFKDYIDRGNVFKDIVKDLVSAE